MFVCINDVCVCSVYVCPWCCVCVIPMCGILYMYMMSICVCVMSECVHGMCMYEYIVSFVSVCLCMCDVCVVCVCTRVTHRTTKKYK